MYKLSNNVIFNEKNYNNNNYPKTYPAKYCNNTKLNKQNNDIYMRNIPSDNMKILEDYRSFHKICDKQINLNTTDYNINYFNKINYFDNIKSTLQPGKGIGTTYLKNIDIDSTLKLQNNSIELNYWLMKCV